MKAEFLNREINTVSMKMEITAEEFDSAIDKVYKENKHRFTVPGFRKGKAPRKMIENHYGSDIFTEDAVSKVFNEMYPKALEEIGYEPVDYPDVDLTDQELKAGSGFTFSIKFLTEPEVTILPGDYMGIEVSVPTTKVTEKDINAQLRSYAMRNARLVTVDREAKMMDTVVLDYKGFTTEGEQFEGGTAENHKLKLGSNEFIPGFEDQLVGVKAGEEKEIEVKFPFDYPEKKLADQVVTFKCTIHEVKEEEPPEINDDLAKECSEFDTLEEWKQELEKKLHENKEMQNQNNIKNEAMKEIYEDIIVDIPEVMIEHEIDELLRQFEEQLSYSGTSLQLYLQETHTNIEEFREQIRYDAERKVKSRLIIQAIAKNEGIEVSEEELTEELKKMGVQYGLDAEKMRDLVGNDIKYIKNDIASKKALDIIAANAVINEIDYEQIEANKSEVEKLEDKVAAAFGAE
jgi:trigger factor